MCHLLQQYSGDPKRLEAVEARYNLERLRMRQDGKIKVPEGIRFAERSPNRLPNKVQPCQTVSCMATNAG